ncbi:MAG: hypothetical protein ACI8S6_002616, partial [Myxococcota bacterium]
TISGIWCASGLAEHGIHLWRGSRDPLIERNVVYNSARGIGLGLSSSVADGERTYQDDPCPSSEYIGHYGGTVRNNVVLVDDSRVFASRSGFDGGIALAAACDVDVLHNTIFSTQPPFASIEWRFAGTSATLANNLVSHNLMERDGASAALLGNIEGAQDGWLEDVAAGDLHLAAGSPAIDAGVVLEAGQCEEDIDREPRDGSPDVGADEVFSPR